MSDERARVVTIPLVPRDNSVRYGKDRSAMKRVIIESPYAAASEAGIARNLRYLRAAMLDSLHRGEAPFASHALYTQVLDDATPDERSLGLAAGFAWGEVADEVAVYEDLGVTEGMRQGILRARGRNQPITMRRLGPEWDKS